MRKIIFVFIIFVFCIGCRKDVQHFPEIESFTATVQMDGRVKLELKLREGKYFIKDVGFFMDTSANPPMIVNQHLASISGNYYTTFYEIDDHSARYYFKAWASNENGATYSKTIYLDSIVMPSINVPCSLPLHVINYGFSPQNFYSEYQSTYSFSPFIWKVTVNTTNGFAKFLFNNYPHQGIYTTTSYTDPDPTQVCIQFQSNSVTDQVDPGSLVYVTEINQDSLEITVCNGEWLFNTTSLTMTARVRVKKY
jgi:hypothetical protein